MASPTAILEPQITLESVSGGDITLNASPEWKKKLVDFLQYAATTDDTDVDCYVSTGTLDEIRGQVFLQINQGESLNISKADLSGLLMAILALSSLNPGDFYDYPADDFDRIHDDLSVIFETVSGKKMFGKKRIKPGISGEFYG